MIFLRKASQPSSHVGINWGHPRAKNLVFAGLPMSVGLRDETSIIGNLTGTNTVVSQSGLPGMRSATGHVLNGSSAYLTNTTQTVATQLPLTFAVWIFSPTTPGSNCRIFDVSTGTTSNDVLGIYTSSSGATVNAQHYDGATNAVAAFAWSIVGKWTRVVSRLNTLASRDLFLNGVLVATNTTSVVAPSGIDRITIGYAPWGPSEWFSGHVVAPMLWTRALTANEIMQDYLRTWDVFNSPRAWLLNAQAAVGGSAFIPLIGRGPGLALAGRGGLAA